LKFVTDALDACRDHGLHIRKTGLAVVNLLCDQPQEQPSLPYAPEHMRSKRATSTQVKMKNVQRGQADVG
jgi:hypothetical protein